jgi:tRNA nucleotidyltransferase (CCA-adding enzyme)
MVIDLVEHHDMEVPQTKKQAARLISSYGHDFLRLWCCLREADRNDHIYPDPDRQPVPMEQVRACIEEAWSEQNAFSVKDLKVNGKDLMEELHIPQGPEIGTLLQKLLVQVQQYDFPNDHALLIAAAGELLQAQKEEDPDYER